MAYDEIQVHEVQYLAATNGKIDDKPIVIVTIRPDRNSYRPHNLAIPLSSRTSVGRLEDHPQPIRRLPPAAGLGRFDRLLG